MQKLYVRAKDTEEMLAMLNIAKNPKRDINSFKLGIILGIGIGIGIGSITTILLIISFITFN